MCLGVCRLGTLLRNFLVFWVTKMKDQVKRKRGRERERERERENVNYPGFFQPSPTPDNPSHK